MSGVLRLAAVPGTQGPGDAAGLDPGHRSAGLCDLQRRRHQFGDEASPGSDHYLAASSPAFLFLRGLPDGTGVGAVVFFQGYAFTAVLAGLMSTFLVVRHTRTDEELGRAELLGSAPLPRAASLTATLVLGAGANLVLAVVLPPVSSLPGCPVPGAVAAGAAVGAVGVFFAGRRRGHRPGHALRAEPRTGRPRGWWGQPICSGVSATRWGPRRGPDPRHAGLALAPLAHRLGPTARPFTSPDLAALLVLLLAALALGAVAA